MSLFVCDKCGTKENSNLILGVSNEKDLSYPNMSLTEMMGLKSKPTKIVVDGETKIFKEATDIVMLCSECNTGKWHGEFEKQEPEDILPALFSKYNMLTIYDHLMGSVVTVTDETTKEKKLALSNDSLALFYKWVYDGMVGLYPEKKDNFNLIIEMEKDRKLFFIYKLLSEDSKNVILPDFNKFKEFTKIEELLFVSLFDNVDKGPSGIWLFLNSVGLIAPNTPFEVCYGVYLDCLKIANDLQINFVKLFVGKNLEKTLLHLLGHSLLINYLTKQSKEIVDNLIKSISDKHWKSEQSVEERERKLKAAAEKRQRKALKKGAV